MASWNRVCLRRDAAMMGAAEIAAIGVTPNQLRRGLLVVAVDAEVHG